MFAILPSKIGNPQSYLKIKSLFFQLMNESVLFTKDEILRGKSKDVFVYGEIIGFNNLEVSSSIQI